MARQPWSELLDAWFDGADTDPAAVPARMAWWFGPDAERDAWLSRRFEGLVSDCASGRNYRWLEQPEGRLALVIALDQLPRNLFRGTARAFENDPYTAALSLAAAATGADRALAPVQRAFLYMPLQHIEDPAGQEAGVTLYERLAEDTPDWPIFRDGFLPYAKQHRDIIDRFGRFPHRNRVLGRSDTAEEAEYLAGDAPRFGQ